MRPIPAEFEMRIATSVEDTRGAERLRYSVFVEELGGNGGEVDHEGRFERDRFDAFADQLVLIDPGVDPQSYNHVIGVYRLLRAPQACAAGGFYSEAEYDLTPLKSSGRTLLELGRSCVDARHRGGAAMFHLWQGVAEYVLKHEIEVLFGVASFHGTDVAALAQPLSHLHHSHLAPPDLRPRAKVHQPMDVVPPEHVKRPAAMKATPALIKAYLRLGGMVGDGAFVDHDFNTVDVCLVVDTEKMSAKHRDIYAKGQRS